MSPSFNETNQGAFALHVAIAGALAGLLHVVSGPDHLVAIAPLSMKRPWLGLRIGIRWGLGHASGVLLVGTAGVMLRTVVDINSLSRWAEFVVGFVLIGVGVWAIAQMRRVVLHKHVHRHAPITPSIAVRSGTEPSSPLSATPVDVGSDGPKNAPIPSTSLNSKRSHVHGAHDEHAHSSPSVTPSPPNHAHIHVHVHQSKEAKRTRATAVLADRGAFFVGLLHGAAGTGHLLGVVPTLSLPPLLGAVYLVSYGIAAVCAMGTFGLSMGLIGNRLAPEKLRQFMLGSGIVAIGLGLYWLYAGWSELSDPVLINGTTWSDLHASPTTTT